MMRANLVGMIQAGLPKHRNYCGAEPPPPAVSKNNKQQKQK
jgi:hypothetical protein